MAGAMLAHASGSVARFRAISFHGQLDTGELVSVFDANNHAGPGAVSRYVAPVAVFGAHVALDQLYNSVRFRLDLPYWLGHLTDGESSVVADDKSILRVEASPDGNWLVYESSAPATLRALEIPGCSELPSARAVGATPRRGFGHPRDAGAH